MRLGGAPERPARLPGTSTVILITEPIFVGGVSSELCRRRHSVYAALNHGMLRIPTVEGAGE